MDQNPLVSDEINGGAEVVHRFDRFMPVQAAVWLKPSDSALWYLYMICDRIDDANLVAGYKEVLRIAREMRTPYIDPLRVKLIGSDDPMARAVIDLHMLYPGQSPVRLRGKMLGGVSTEEIYVYPSLATPVK